MRTDCDREFLRLVCRAVGNAMGLFLFCAVGTAVLYNYIYDNVISRGGVTLPTPRVRVIND